MACSLDWTTGVNVTITNHVAYGPDEVIIGEMASDDVNILLNCTVLGLNPLLPDMIQWGGLCQGQSGFTCQITNSAIVDDRKEVTCTVTNVHNNNHSVTANITITHYGGSKSSPRFQPEGIAVGAGGVLAVVVVVAVVVLMVMWKRGHHLLSCGQSPSAVYEDTSPTHQDTGFHMYTDLRNSKARPASTNKESAGQQSNRGADNTSAELQHGNDDNMYQNM
nr:hypothetical protein BaRGS_000976 [Batillaria attramentaria]